MNTRTSNPQRSRFAGAIACAVWLLALSACTTPSERPVPKPEPADSPRQCGSLRTGGPAFKPSGLAGPSGWVVVRYSLDGSGSAQDIQAVDFFRASSFSNDVLRYVRASEFAKGEVRAVCQEVFSFVQRRG